MGSSLYSGVSGLNASSSQMDVIGNNIANVNTIGFKASKIHFGDILSQSISGGSSFMQIGRGVSVNSVGTEFLVGSFETTGSATDLAIDGNGFFMVNDSDGGTFYTRAGSFSLDSNDYLVDVNGYKVQGYNLLSSDPNLVTDISLQDVQSQPAATTSVSIGVNLDAEAATGDVFNASQTVYDSLGAEHTLNIAFTKEAAVGTWTGVATLDGVAAASTLPTPLTIVFDDSGAIDTIGGAAAANITLTLAALTNGATIGAAGVVTWDIISPSAGTMTGYASSSSVTSLASDGYSSGILKGLSVGQDGIISGSFTNGQTAEVAQIVLAAFSNPGGLVRMGDNLFGETIVSGSALQNIPGSAGVGEINSNSLEMSNVDIAAEFVNMITAQRAYQASSKVITTTDAMMSELMNIKR